MAPSADSLRSRREEIVREHMESENRYSFDETLATFHHPRYELVGTDEVFDGPEEVMRYYEETRAAFPDQRNETLAIHHADAAVLVEAVVRGTHTGAYKGLPPTGRKFELPILAVFVFEQDQLVCERVYFDSNTVLRQLGIARDPTSLTGRLETVVGHPLTISRSLVRRVTGR
ncbi:MAG: ester cyclase [Solirubrobacterales bacterium]|nr:ester cyclase [Solirubrobacterales bacterium]